MGGDNQSGAGTSTAAAREEIREYLKKKENLNTAYGMICSEIDSSRIWEQVGELIEHPDCPVDTTEYIDTDSCYTWAMGASMVVDLLRYIATGTDVDGETYVKICKYALSMINHPHKKGEES